MPPRRSVRVLTMPISSLRPVAWSMSLYRAKKARALSSGDPLPIWTGGHRAAASARVNAQLQQLLAQRELRRMELDLNRRDAENDLSQAAAEADLASRSRAIA